MKFPQYICFLILIKTIQTYLDIQLNIQRQGKHISYAIPTQVNDINYFLSISLCDCKQFVRPITQKQNKKKKHKKNKQSKENMLAMLKASSLEGYSFEGWRRFFMQTLLFFDSRYYHDIFIDLSTIDKKTLPDQQNYHDGVIKFGPNLPDNKFFKLLKDKSQFVKKNVISIYRGIDDKNVRVQFGGFEQSFAKGLNNGILFYQLALIDDKSKWKIPVKAVSCLRMRNNHEDIFYVANSDINVAISIQSPFLKLPKRFADDIQRNFETSISSCKISQKSQLICDHLTSVDLALNYIQFKIDDGAFINISLYDLRDSYQEKSKQTTFFIQFINSQNDIELGQALFKAYYVSIDMQNKKMLYSPLNRFPASNYSIYIIRFMICFGVFTFVVALIAMIWQIFSDPFRKNKVMLGQDGIKLVTYQRPNDLQD